MIKPHMVIGVDLGGTHLRAALVNEDGRLLARERTASGSALAPEEALRRLTAQCRTLITAARADGARVAAIGLGAAGSIDRRAGRIVHSPNLPRLNGFLLAPALERELGLPVFLENDANVYGLGETWQGAGVGIRNWVGLTLGTGVGGCLIFEHQLWRGDDLGFAGEIGHLPVLPGGSVCACGAVGCLETLASGSALARGVTAARDRGQILGPALEQAADQGRITPLAVFQAARAGDPLACELFATLGWALGVALAGLFSVLGIRTAIIGGGVSGAWELFEPSLRRALRDQARMFDPQLARVKRAALGDDAALLGAARLALDALANRR